ncbi:DUF6150 family protein [Trinickia caryophylli]|uniref:7(1) septoil knot domain-containing protein n=1 Tax=Trinickia caryophylli TaxID=28094 RepID=A0A1X7D5B6_TRICW|nr:DUF6150 family protein [Trinickia caryophylli]PMS12827.1 hypothetical protein C0Z17_07780 [Trinickia caryophylli]TRX15128.1 hypothetical protein FNF07_28450 [Trinickia caryophylli]WQE14991.1 DUF6150 family protein [Trinickia caryophylli]SMF09098.1 hypothetical protein SAMN06295900_102406 [Trinickia caryophylli]GLU31280.1 hypothetical protein Busp01_11220 [Trinickia caryophylli]
MARIYQAESMGMADVRIALVRDRARADLLACRVSSYGMATGDARWFITTDRAQATVTAYFCDEGSANLRVCFVSSLGEAGWLRLHRLQGRLG